MLKRIFALLCVLMLHSVAAYAQMQQGYSKEYGQPDVQVDRSVLEELKGYTPPPMFAPAPAETEAPAPIAEKKEHTEKVTPAKTVSRHYDQESQQYKQAHFQSSPEPTAAPQPVKDGATPSPTLSAEAILNHPVDMTEPSAGEIIIPEGDAPPAYLSQAGLSQLPVPTGNISPAITAHPVNKNAVPQAKPASKKVASTPKTTPAKPLSKTATAVVATKVATKSVTPKAAPAKAVPADIIPVVAAPIIPPVDPAKAYRPKSSTGMMPAVPPIKVEKNELAPPPSMPPATAAGLPPLPNPSDNMMDHSKPTVGERIIDAALTQHIETDEKAIKQKIETKPVMVASLSPAKTPAVAAAQKTSSRSLIFAAGQTSVTKNMESQFRDTILPQLANDTTSRIQILSFATSPDKTESTARRISLSRALAVRDYMMAQNIDAGRIDVRALANQGAGTPADRVDVVLLKP